VPVEVGALTINKVCGSGLKAVMLAAAAIRAGDGDFYAAGGMENMNLAPFLLTKARFGYRLGNAELVDAIVHDGLWCPFERQHMGLAAEWIAEQYAVSRRAQDEFACASHRKALAAIDAGRFRAEITAVPLAQRKGAPIPFDTDENPRRDTSLEALSTLKPVFKDGGAVTAGNAPGITDGAAALIVARRSAAARVQRWRRRHRGERAGHHGRRSGVDCGAPERGRSSRAEAAGARHGVRAGGGQAA
jgi:acetyl-CoA C-acetyltransferase